MKRRLDTYRMTTHNKINTLGIMTYEFIYRI